MLDTPFCPVLSQGGGGCPFCPVLSEEGCAHSYESTWQRECLGSILLTCAFFVRGGGDTHTHVAVRTTITGNRQHLDWSQTEGGNSNNPHKCRRATGGGMDGLLLGRGGAAQRRLVALVLLMLQQLARRVNAEGADAKLKLKLRDTNSYHTVNALLSLCNCLWCRSCRTGCNILTFGPLCTLPPFADSTFSCARPRAPPTLQRVLAAFSLQTEHRLRSGACRPNTDLLQRVSARGTAARPPSETLGTSLRYTAALRSSRRGRRLVWLLRNFRTRDAFFYQVPVRSQCIGWAPGASAHRSATPRPATFARLLCCCPFIHCSVLLRHDDSLRAYMSSPVLLCEDSICCCKVVFRRF